MQPEDSTPRVAVSIERTVNLGNYENVKVFLSVSNLLPDVTDEAIEDALETSRSAYALLKVRLKEEVAEIRSKSAAARQRSK